MTTLIPSFTAVIAALNISLGADVGGFFLETIAKELNAEVCTYVPVWRRSVVCVLVCLRWARFAVVWFQPGLG